MAKSKPSKMADLQGIITHQINRININRIIIANICNVTNLQLQQCGSFERDRYEKHVKT